jgi:hypothetical protein
MQRNLERPSRTLVTGAKSIRRILLTRPLLLTRPSALLTVTLLIGLLSACGGNGGGGGY